LFQLQTVSLIYFVHSTRVAESEIKYLPPTFPKFPTPDTGFPKFPTSTP